MNCGITLSLPVFVRMIRAQVLSTVHVCHQRKEPLLTAIEASGYVANNGLRFLAEVFWCVVEQSQVVGKLGIGFLYFWMSAPRLDDFLNQWFCNLLGVKLVEAIQGKVGD